MAYILNRSTGKPTDATDYATTELAMAAFAARNIFSQVKPLSADKFMCGSDVFMVMPGAHPSLLPVKTPKPRSYTYTSTARADEDDTQYGSTRRWSR